MLINQTYKNLGLLLLSTLILIALNISLSKTFFRVDLSADKLHSISNNTKELLRSLDTSNYTLNAEVYLEGDFPAEIEKLELVLKEKLTEFKAYSSGNFKIKFYNINLEVNKHMQKPLMKSGLFSSTIFIKGDNKNQEIKIWPVMKLHMGEKTENIQFLQPGGLSITQQIINIFTDQIEYKFVKAVLKLNQSSKKRISFLKGHGELNEVNIQEIKDKLREFYFVDSVFIKQIKSQSHNTAVKIAEEKYDSLIENQIDTITIGKDRINIFTDNNDINKGAQRRITEYFYYSIIKNYKKQEINFNFNINALKKNDLLVIARPRTTYQEEEKYIIDQYIMNGGKVIWLLDMIHVDEVSLKDSSFTMTKPIEHGLQPFLFKYGVRFNTNIICDSKCSPVYRRDKRGFIDNWFFHPVVSLNPVNKFTLNVSPIKLRYASTVDIVGENNNTVTKLLEPSDNYKVMRNTRVNYLNTYNYDPSNFETNEDINKPSFGWLIEGVFESNYKNRNLNENFKAFINDPRSDFKNKSVETKMAFISDGDLIRNDYVLTSTTKTPIPVRLHSEVSYYYGYENEDNKAILNYGNDIFFLNIVDELLGRNELIPLRSKMSFPRLIKKDAYDNKYFWQLINILLPIIGVILFAFSYWTIRKRKYRN